MNFVAADILVSGSGGRLFMADKDSSILYNEYLVMRRLWASVSN